MSRWARTGLAVAAVALVAALAVLLERGGGGRALDTTVSTRNGDPRGLLAAYRYLDARGAAPRRLEGPLRDPTGVLVLPAATVRALRPEEVEAALAVPRAGGVLVVLAPTGEDLAASQPALARALGARRVRRTGVVETEHPDGRDASEQVLRTWDDPILGGGRYFLARVEAGIAAHGAETVAAAGETPVVVRRPLGAGSVYLFSTPTLLENHRLDLADNLRLLEGLALLARTAGGPLRFDEAHHRGAQAGEAGSLLGHPAVLAGAVQLALVGLVLLAAVGRRFGPIRPLVVDRRRSALEYVESLAALYRRAGDEAALVEEVRRDLRRRLLDRFGVSAALDEAEAARRLEARTGVPEDEIASAFDALNRAPDLRAALALAAALERRLDGLRDRS